MPLGNGAASKERRKTQPINDSFREQFSKDLSEAVGLKLDGRQAITLLKVATRSIMRFLMTLDEKDFDQYGDRVVAIQGVGRFKIMNTIPQGRRVDLVGKDGKYPRFKYYPASNIEAEVEILNGIESPEGREIYERTIKSENANVDKNVQEISHLIRTLTQEAMETLGNVTPVGVGKSNTNVDLNKVLESLVKELVIKELNKVSNTVEESDDESDEDLEENSEFEGDDETDAEEEVEEVAPPVEEKKSKVKAKKETVETVKAKKETVKVAKPVKAEKAPVVEEVPTAEDEINNAVDSFDFDFNT